MHNVHARQYAVCRRRAPCAIELCGYILSAATEKTIITLNDRAEQKKKHTNKQAQQQQQQQRRRKKKITSFYCFRAAV